MAYPFAGFGGFQFTREERYIDDTDSGWNWNPSYDTSRPIGGTDSVVMLAPGSARRSFICRMYPDRFESLRSLIGTAGSFVDWDRPDPDARDAVLMNVTTTGFEFVDCPDGVTRRVELAQVELLTL